MKKTIIAVLTILAVGTFAQKRTVGLQLYSLKDSMRVNVPATLKAVAGMGYQVVETAGYDNGKLYGYTPREFNNLVREQGMEVASAHVSHPNEPEAMKWWDLALDTQKAAGCTYVFMPSMPDFKTIEEVREFCNYFNEVGKLARTKGLRFGYHNHSAEFGKIGDEVIFDKMVEFTDPRYVTFQLDVHNAMNGGADPVALIRKHGKRIAVLHVKDDGIVGESGKLDFREIVVAAKKAGIKDYYIEVESYRLPPFECVQTSVENLKNCF